MDEPEPPRRVEAVDFAPVPIGGPGRRARSQVTIGAFVVLLAAVVAFATVGRSSPSDPTGQVAGARPGQASPAVASPALTTPAPVMVINPSLAGRLRASDPQPVALNVKQTPGGLSVQGTVLMRAVATLAIRVVDGAGADIAARSLSLEYPDAGAIRPGNPSAFAVLIGLSEGALRDAQFVEVDAYDSLGETIGSALHWLPPLHAA